MIQTGILATMKKGRTVPYRKNYTRTEMPCVVVAFGPWEGGGRGSSSILSKQRLQRSHLVPCGHHPFGVKSVWRTTSPRATAVALCPGVCVCRSASNRRAGAGSRPRQSSSRSLLKAQQALFATRVHILTPLSFMVFQEIQSNKQALWFRCYKLPAAG